MSRCARARWLVWIAMLALAWTDSGPAGPPVVAASARTDAIPVVALGRFPAAAARPPSGDAPISATVIVTPTTGVPGTRVVITGTGFLPGELVVLRWGAPVTRTFQTIKADATGQFTTRNIGVPTTAPAGALPLIATGAREHQPVVADFTVTAPWSTFRYGMDRTGLNPYENIISTGTVGSLTAVWNKPASLSASPTVAGGLVYVLGPDRGFQALSAATGAVVWVSSLGVAGYYAAPTIADGLAFWGAADGSLVALNAQTGGYVWRNGTGNAIYGSPAVSNGMVYAGSGDGSVYAFDEQTGVFRWSHATGDAISGSPALWGGHVIIGSQDGYLYSLNARTGALVWRTALGGPIMSTPAIGKDVVYVDTWSGALAAVAVRAGRVIWRHQAAAGYDASPAVDDTTVYAGSGDGLFAAFDVKRGHIRWIAQAGGPIHYASPALAGGLVFWAAYDGELYAHDAWTGAIRWSQHLGGSLSASPAVSDGRVYMVGGATFGAGTLSVFGITGMAPRRRGV